jgi:hypothetical protein
VSSLEELSDHYGQCEKEREREGKPIRVEEERKK